VHGGGGEVVARQETTRADIRKSRGAAGLSLDTGARARRGSKGNSERGHSSRPVRQAHPQRAETKEAERQHAGWHRCQAPCATCTSTAWSRRPSWTGRTQDGPAEKKRRNPGLDDRCLSKRLSPAMAMHTCSVAPASRGRGTEEDGDPAPGPAPSILPSSSRTTPVHVARPPRASCPARAGRSDWCTGHRAQGTEHREHGSDATWLGRRSTSQPPGGPEWGRDEMAVTGWMIRTKFQGLGHLLWSSSSPRGDGATTGSQRAPASNHCR
jgi:hypothetical protein